MSLRISGGLLLLSLIYGEPLWGQIATLETTFSLRQVDDLTVPFQNGMPVPLFEKQTRPTISLAGTWRKQRFHADHALTLRKRDASAYADLLSEAAGRVTPEYDDAGWDLKTLPGVENTMNAYETPPEYYEDGVWYRRSFAVPPSLQGARALLKFLAVNYVADVWLNGSYLGWHEGGYTPFAFDATPALRFDSLNVLVVRVDNIPWNPTQTQDLANNRRIDIVPYYRCDWFNYTGIIHDVYLEFSDPVTVVRADVVPLGIDGGIRSSVAILNSGPADTSVTVSLEIFEASIDSTNVGTEYPADLIGMPAAVTGTLERTLVIPKDSCRAWRTNIAVASPRLWSPLHPHLYILKVTIAQGGVTLDELTTQFGIRTVSVSGTMFLLNQQPTFFPGIARHEDHPLYGRSLPPEVITGDLKRTKALNASFLRTAHYPNAPSTYLVADRLGLAVMEEIPVWWFDTETAWLIQNAMRHVHTQMWREMVFRDYNRPSVIFWSTCNECLAVGGRETFISAVRSELNTLYPDGRLVTQSAAADRPGASDPSQAACDVPGWTMYFGIFHGGTYYDGTKSFLEAAHGVRPSVPLCDTEFGYWSTESGSEQWKQRQVFDSTFLAFSEVSIRDRDGAVRPWAYLMATTWWCAFDWYTAQQPYGFQSMGVYHMDRTTAKLVTPVLASTYAPYYQNSEVTSVPAEAADSRPDAIQLYQNYPNPFNPETTFSFYVPEAARVRLDVIDLLGRDVATVLSGTAEPGFHSVRWRSRGVSSGIYFYRLATGGTTRTRTLMVLK